jgi:hypothetical protein
VGGDLTVGTYVTDDLYLRNTTDGIELMIEGKGNDDSYPPALSLVEDGAVAPTGFRFLYLTSSNVLKLRRGDGTGENFYDVLTVNRSDGEATFASNLNVSGDVDLAGHDLRCGNYANLTDDSATSFTPSTVYGVLFLYFFSGTRALGMISYRASSSPAGYVITQEIAGRIEIATTSLDGTTGADGKFTVGVTDGTIYLENRLGGTAQVGYFTLGY